MNKSEIVVSAPGRMCLFGEHQDYLGLPVVAAAINLRVEIRARPVAQPRIVINMPDTGEREEIRLDEPLKIAKPRDYFRSAIRILRYEGLKVEGGFEAELTSDIPIAKGVSSSSAILVAWIALLAGLEGRELPPEEIAGFAYRAEVREFGEPGGMMDHYTSAIGGLLYIECGEETVPYRLDVEIPGWFLLCDSGERKNTTGVLGLVKRAVHEGVGELEKRVPGFSTKDFGAGEAESILSDLPVGVRRAVAGAHLNRDITREGLSMFRRGRVDEKQLGDFFNRQQEILRDDLCISTEKVDALIAAALGAGALGCKINGSGGGGCMIAYGAGNPGGVIEAVERAGGTAVRVVLDKGVEMA